MVIDLVDADKQIFKYQTKRRNSLILFILVSVFSTIAIVLLMVFSSENYIANLIFTILFFVILLFFFIFYFTVWRKYILDHLNFFEGVKKTKHEEIEFEILGFEKEKKEYDGISFYVLNVKCVENFKTVEKNILCLKNEIPFQNGEKVFITIFGKVAIKMEKKK